MIKRDAPLEPPKKEFTVDDQLDYIFYDEVSLLTVLILLQLSNENETSVPFKVFSQYPFEKKEDIVSELGDYQNLADYIYNQCFHDYLSDNDLAAFFTIDKITIDSENIVAEILENFAKSLVEPESAKDIAIAYSLAACSGVSTERSLIANHYSYVVEHYFSLRQECGFKKEYINNKFTSEFSVEPEKFGYYSRELLDSAPKSIQLNFVFKSDKAQEAEKKMDEYLIFNYEEEDLIQFQDYISNLKFINGNLKIPFEAILEEEFNVVETLQYLDLTGEIEIQSWTGRNHHWEIKLLSKEMLAIFVPNIDLLIQKKDDIQKIPEVYFTEDGKLEYDGKEPIFNLTPLRKILCEKLCSKEANYIFDTGIVEQALYGGESNKQSQEKLKQLIKGLNRKVRDEFGIKEWIHYGANNLRRRL